MKSFGKAARFALGLILFVPLAARAQAADGVPIDAFGKVTPDLYRGARPSQEGLTALAAMGIKTDLDVEDDDGAIAQERSWATGARLRFVSEPMNGFFAPSDARVSEIFAVLHDPSGFPIFIHCQHGHDRTGLIVGLYRVLDQAWTPQAAYDEMIAQGFHPELLGLDYYFREKTGFDGN